MQPQTKTPTKTPQAINGANPLSLIAGRARLSTDAPNNASKGSSADPGPGAGAVAAGHSRGVEDVSRPTASAGTSAPNGPRTSELEPAGKPFALGNDYRMARHERRRGRHRQWFTTTTSATSTTTTTTLPELVVPSSEPQAVGAPVVTSVYPAQEASNLPVDPASGQLLVVAVVNDTWAAQVSSISGGGATSWSEAGAPFVDSTDGKVMSIWWGDVTTGGASMVTVNWDGTTDRADIAAQAFMDNGASSWSLTAAGAAGTPFPALSAGEDNSVYFGAAMAWGDGAAGDTSGVTL